MRMTIAAIAALIGVLLGNPAPADVITVTIGSSDPIDIDWQTGTIEDLPGPDGHVSFSEAMIAANNTPGHDTIGFAIPESDWVFQFLFPGRAVVLTSNAYFWRAWETVTIDGTTQTAFTGDTNPDGAEVVLYGGELYLNVDSCTVLGLDSSVINFGASYGVAQGNTGTTNLTFVGGSGGWIQGNIGGTLKIDRSSDNLVVGNTFQRIRILGFGPTQFAANNRIGGPDPEDRNFFTGLGAWNSEGLPSGFSVQLFDSDNTVIENNSIGSTPNGLAQGSEAATMGIRFEGENRNTVIRNNRIAGVLGHGIGPHYAGQIFGWAIYISGAGSGINIVGNTIGLDANGDPVLGSVTGIEVGTFNFNGISDIRIGGTDPAEGNAIAGHLFNGITVGRDVPQARISANRIYGNEDLGIDLVTSGYAYGVTPNDPLDSDTGGNGLQNYPEIESAMTNGTTVQVLGGLHSSPSSQFTVEFFASPECDPSGFGEGQIFLGSTSVITDEAGNADFDVPLTASVEGGWALTSTATLEPLGATSEFSACAVIMEDVTAIEPGDEVAGRDVIGLSFLQSSPNPFHRKSAIRYALPREGQASLAVYDAAGRLIRVLVDADQPAGVHATVWDGRNARGEEVAAGVYFYRLRLEGESHTRQVIFAR